MSWRKTCFEWAAVWTGSPAVFSGGVIHTIKIPKEILETVWQDTSWEPEFFIPEDKMDQMRVVKSEIFSREELESMNKKGERIKHSINTPLESNKIKEISKTNIAAKYYIELFSLYNQKLLIRTRFPYQKFFAKEKVEYLLKKLKSFILETNCWGEKAYIKKLTKDQEAEVSHIVDRLKSELESF